MRFLWLRISIAGAVSLCSNFACAADEAPSAAALEFFERNVRPILADRCYECHGPDSKPEGGLRLDTRGAVLKGGESGSAVVPGNPEESLLVDAVRYGDIFKMPPKSKLPADEIAALTEWVRLGAPWPGDDGTGAGAGKQGVTVTDEDRAFWAFVPPRESPLPVVARSDWPQSPLDRFILAGLEENRLSPAPPVDKRTLIRRVTFDLIGLPPTPDEVEAFVADEAPDAFARVVDRLLASPRYGERWGRHWLDVARYADSNGMDENLAFEHAWRYRDYVVNAFNADLPYDQFIREQLAGDLLPPAGDPRIDFPRIVATGFLSLGPKMLAEDDPVKMEMDIVDEQVDTVGRVFMGLTLGCARCHDHKFDPIPSEDYYSLAGIFKSTKTMENYSVVAIWHERPLATAAELAAIATVRQRAAEKQATINSLTADANAELLREGRARLRDYLIAAGGLAGRRELPPSALANVASPPDGTLIVEAEKFQRGNGKIDFDNYGKEIGVVYNAGQLPNVSEYEIEIPAEGVYQLELRYAAAGARPVRLSVNGRLIRSDAAGNVTGTWYPDSQSWFVEAVLSLAAGKNTVLLECDGPFPHFDKLALVANSAADATNLTPFQTPEQVAAERGLNPAFLRQWLKHLATAKEDAGSPWHALSVWNDKPESAAAAAAQADATASPRSPVESDVLKDPRPATLNELADRYVAVFEAAELAWRDLQGKPAEAQAAGLADLAQQALRQSIYDGQGPFAIPEKPENFYSPATIAALKALRDEMAQIQAAMPAAPQTMAVEDRQVQNLRVHLRGNHLTLGQEVPRRFPRVMAGDDQAPLDSQHSGRLALADWLAQPDHPLTARVMANRIWRWHFGRALVRSPDNFGRLGERPTHPALLDWLALQFVESGWSMKALHRTILLSATYQMSTAYDDRAALADPENRLLWRMNRRRLEAEALRDAVLAASGQLDGTMGGSILVSKNREYVAGTASTNPTNYNTLRRSIYLPVVRSAVYEMFQAFDFADPSTSNGDRDSTTVPGQALFMMNGKLILEQTRRMAQELLSAPKLDDAARVSQVYLQCFARLPSAAESGRALDFVGRYEAALAASVADAAERRLRAWEGLCRALMGTNEFLYLE